MWPAQILTLREQLAVHRIPVARRGFFFGHSLFWVVEVIIAAQAVP